jgi:hypothetical protein
MDGAALALWIRTVEHDVVLEPVDGQNPTIAQAWAALESTPFDDDPSHLS